MAGVNSDAQQVEDFLSRAPQRWLDAGADQADLRVREILQWHALYRALTADLPDLTLTSPIMTMICEESGIRGGFLSCTEMSRGGWFGGEADARAAAILGRNGDLEAVLVACTFLAQGFDIYGGDGRPLLDGYRFLLPAVASYFAADSGISLTDLKLPPGWWDHDGVGPTQIKPNVLTYAVNPRLDEEQRRALLGRGPGLVDVDMFGSTARLLGMDLSFLSGDELSDVEDSMSELIEALGEEEPEEDPLVYEDYQLEPMSLGYLVGAFGDTLLEEVPQTPSRAATSSLTPSNWVDAWGSCAVMDPQLWPSGPLREAIGSSPW